MQIQIQQYVEIDYIIMLLFYKNQHINIIIILKNEIYIIIQKFNKPKINFFYSLLLDQEFRNR